MFIHCNQGIDDTWSSIQASLNQSWNKGDKENNGHLCSIVTEAAGLISLLWINTILYVFLFLLKHQLLEKELIFHIFIQTFLWASFSH